LAISLSVIAALACVGCGRIGVELISEQLTDAGRPADEVPEPELVDGSVEQTDAAVPAMTIEEGGVAAMDGALALQDASAADASPGLDAASGVADAGPTRDAAAPDASMRDAAAPDASTPDAAVSGCQLMVGGASVTYGVGDVGALEGTHLLSLVSTGRCAIPTGCGTESGSDVVQASCSVSTCQMWESRDAGSGWSYLRNVKSGLCMYVEDGVAGTGLVDWECIGGNQMHWRAVCAGSNTWYLVNRFSSFALEGSASGIVQSTQDGSQAQRWAITSNASAYAVIVATAETDSNPVWRYTTSTPASTWTQPGFNDSSWSTGPGGFGSQARAFTPIRTSWTSRDIWLRRSFTLSSVPSNLTVKIFHDEGVDVYINGMLAVSLSEWSNGYVATDAPLSVRNALVVGSNSIAVHCQNSADLQILDVGLFNYTWR
jgi:hypothetical protein